MTDTWQPDEADIARVLEKYSPRQVAIAYLRAKREARQARQAFDLMDKVSGALVDAVTGDWSSAQAQMKSATLTARTMKEAEE